MKKILLPLLFTLFTITGRGQMILPFYEPWDMGSFGFQMWSFSPNQGNWYMNTVDGNPAPAATFSGIPSRTDYHDTLISYFFWGNEFRNCGQFKLEFDLKLENGQNTSTEAFGVAVWYGSTWHLFADIYNYNSFDWTHFSYLLPHEVTQGSFRLGFVGHGQNTSNINKWLLDNIYLSFKCFPPESFTASMMGSYCHLRWEPPSCSMDTAGQNMMLMGYDVYRKSCDETQFQRLNTTLVADTVYDDHYSSGSCFYYYVTALYNSISTNTFLCESVTTDSLYLMFEGVDRQNKSNEISLYPNPADKKLFFKCIEPVLEVQLSDLSGRTVYRSDRNSGKELSFSCERLENGIYFLRVRTENGEFCRKVIVQH